VRPLTAFQYANLLSSGYTDQLFQDDFTDTDSVLLANHTVTPRNNTKDVWHDPNSKWKITSNAIVPNNTVDRDGSTYIDLGTAEFDIAFSQYVDSAASYDAGINIRLMDANNLFYLRLHSDDAGRVDIVKKLRGTSYGVVAYSKAWTITTGWHQVLVKVRRDRIVVWVDGTQYIDYLTKTLSNVSKVGFDRWNGCTPKFDTFQIWRPFRFYEAFADWSNWATAKFGYPLETATGISGKWGTLQANAIKSGVAGGESAVLNVSRLGTFPVLRDSVFQFQIGGRKNTPSGSYYSESGVSISDTASGYIATEQNSVHVVFKNTSTGSRIVLRKIVSGISTDLILQGVATGEFAENVRVRFYYNSYFGQTMLEVYTSKYGTMFSGFCAWMPELVYVKNFTRTDDAEKGFTFSQDGQRVNFGTDSAFDIASTSATIMMRLKNNDIAALAIPLSRGGYSLGQGFYLQIYAGNWEILHGVSTVLRTDGGLAGTQGIFTTWFFVKTGGGTWKVFYGTESGVTECTYLWQSTSDPSSLSRALYIGAYDENNYHFPGEIKDVRWWNKVLSAGEMTTANAGGDVTGNLVERWKFREESGTVAVGSVAGKNGTIENPVAGFWNVDKTAVGFFRDFGVFPSRKMLVGGEVGFYDDFKTFNEGAWCVSSRAGYDTQIFTDVIDERNALQIYSSGPEWCFASQANDCNVGDFVFEGEYKQGDRVNIYFCLQDPDPDYAKGYGVQFETGTTRFVKDTSDNGSGHGTILKTRADVLTPTAEVFTVKIVKQGTRTLVYKNSVLIFDVTDASYESGLFGYQSYDTTGFYCFWHKMSPRGLQQPVQLRIDRPMIQNASFEDWDDQDGMSYDTGSTPNSWKSYMSTSGALSRSASGSDGGDCIKIAITNPQADAYFQSEVYQRLVRFLRGHRYRMSCQLKVENRTANADAPIFSDDCRDTSTWTEDAWPANKTLSSDGESIEFSMPSAPPSHLSAIREAGVIDVTTNPKVRISIPEVTGTIQWKLGVATALPDNTGAGVTWLNGYSSNAGTFTYDLVDAGLSGPQYLYFVLWFTGAFYYEPTYHVAVDYLRVLPYGGLIQGEPGFYLKAMAVSNQPLGTHMVQLASPTENLVAFDTWQQVDFDFVADENWTVADTNYVTAMVSCEYPNNSSYVPIGDFNVFVDQILIEDITGFAVGEEPALQWTETPVTYRGRETDREDPEDYWKAFYTMPHNIIWRIGEAFTWGLLDENYADLFTSRLYSQALPGSEWKLKPEWIACDLGVALTLNQVVFYPYYSNGIRSLLVTSGGPTFSEHIATMVMQGLTTYSSTLRLDVEMAVGILTRYCQIVILDTDVEGNTATCQQVELYNFSDESDHVNHSEGGAPDVSITQSRPADKLNSLPNAATCTLSVINKDERYTPSNKYSPIYGPYKQADGLGDIRAGVPLRISVVATDKSGSTPVEYETLVFMGTLGVDKNKGAALGISLDGASRMASIDAVDTTVVLDQPVPVDTLNPLEAITAEDTMRTLCYLAGIPYQDMTFDVTGVTFPVVVFRDQTMRENIQQLVQAIGGRFYTTRDGRLRYQNVAVNRSWTLTERQEFEAGTKSLIDTQSVAGEFFADNVAWDVNHIFSVYPENQPNMPWSVSRPDSWRFLASGEYVVMTPAGSNSAMQHIRKAAYNKTRGFTLEYDISLADSANFDVWGYTDDVVDYYTAACAWRLRIYKTGSALYADAGGTVAWYGSAKPLFSEAMTAFLQNTRVRIRIRVDVASYTIYINDQVWKTVALTSPRLIRWNSYESNSEYDDNFDPARAGHLHGSTGQKNTTLDTWHDPNNRWWRDASGYLRPGSGPGDFGSNDDHTTYLDFGCPDYRLKGKVYLDRTNARDGGWTIKYVDANNWMAVQLFSMPDATNPNGIMLNVNLRRMKNGVFSVLAQAQTQLNIFEGSQLFCIDVSAFDVRIYMQPYNPEQIWNAQWRQVLYYSFDFNALGTDLCGSTKFAPYAKQGTDGRISWDDLEVDYGSGSYLGYSGNTISYVINGVGYSAPETAVIYTESSWYNAPADDYSGKIVIGPEPAQLARLTTSNYPNWQLGTYKPGYRMAYFRQKMIGAITPLGDGRNGSLISPRHLCGTVASWGVFEAEISGIGPKIFSGGMLDQVSNVDFFVQVSNDGNTWDPWVKVTPGQLIPDTVALKSYFRWKAEFWKNRALLDQWLSPNMFIVYWKAHVKSATLNWQIAAAITEETFRATWNIKADSTEGTTGIETNAGSYSLGNPEANRVTALVNRWVEQLITDVTKGDPLWQSSELPTILNAGQVYEITAKYPYPSKKGSGATLRHCHVDVNGTTYVVNDGAGNVTCGNATVRLDSGQGVGTITITGNAANTVINSARIDAVAYKPASDLYGTEQVSVEDVPCQNLLGRIIETDTFDNSFAMSRAIASAYANAELTRTKQFKESIQGVQIPLLPTLSLEQFGIIHNPIMGIYERQVSPTEITHQGFVSLISAEGVRTNEESEDFAPLTLSLTGAFATHRLTGCASSYILKIRDGITGNEFEVYDCCQYFPYFKTASDGEWIDGTDLELYVSAIYDQTGNSRDLLQATEANQPRILFETKNGFPSIVFDGINDRLVTSVFVSDFISASNGIFISGAMPQGTIETGAEAWNLAALLGDSLGWLGLTFGNKDGAGDMVHAFNWELPTPEADAYSAFDREAWSVFAWKHSGALIKIILNGTEMDSANTGNTGSLSEGFCLGALDGCVGAGGAFFNGKFSALFSAVTLSDTELEKLNGYIQAH
jgi:hypothetical protein